MTTVNDFDRRLTDWLDDVAAPQKPEYFDELLGVTRRTHQRPAWASLERWLPMQRSIPMSPVPFPRTAWLLIVLAIVIAMAVLGTALIGGHRGPPTIGPARNGLLALATDGRISIQSLDGSGLTTITPATEVDALPSWSPDGTRLAFFSRPPRPNHDPSPATGPPLVANLVEESGSIVVINADGSGRRVLATGIQLADPLLFAPRWSHDSTRLAVGIVEGGQPAIEVLSMDGARTFHLLGADAPTWSPDDRQLAFREVDTGVFTAPADGPAVPTRMSTAAGTGLAFALPEWSPDGTTIAFQSGDDDSHDIFTVGSNGTDEQAVSTRLADEYWPVWSPDGSRLAFERVVDDNNHDVFVIAAADGSTVTQLQTPLLAAAPFSWSPDGRDLIGRGVKTDLTGVDRLLVVDTMSSAPPIIIPGDAEVSWQRQAP